MQEAHDPTAARPFRSCVEGCEKGGSSVYYGAKRTMRRDLLPAPGGAMMGEGVRAGGDDMDEGEESQQKK